MSFWIERSKAVSKQPGSSLPRPKIVLITIRVLVFACGVASAQVVTSAPGPSIPEVDSGEIRTLSVEATLTRCVCATPRTVLQPHCRALLKTTTPVCSHH